MAGWGAVGRRGDGPGEGRKSRGTGVVMRRAASHEVRETGLCWSLGSHVLTTGGGAGYNPSLPQPPTRSLVLHKSNPKGNNTSPPTPD